MLSKYSISSFLNSPTPYFHCVHYSHPQIFILVRLFPFNFFTSNSGFRERIKKKSWMKFGKRLKQQVQETLPGWHDKFLSYKDLKKLVRLISSAPPMMNGSLEFGKAEAEFMYLLNNEIEKFNSFFMEQEEDFVIRHKELQQRIERVTEIWGPNGSQPLEMDYKEEMGKIRKEIVNFHGEMVLLMNYSNINYTECESTIDAMFPVVEEEERIIRREREAIMVSGEGVFRNTIAALLTIQEIRRGSSTYGHFSLPPINLPDFDFIQAFQLNSPIPIP
ncbi:unnamed protein product [Camellia sinensis]